MKDEFDWDSNLSSHLNFALEADPLCRKGCNSHKKRDGTSDILSIPAEGLLASTLCMQQQHLCNLHSAVSDSPENRT